MTLEERSGRRDLVYSAWHRADSIRRFLPIEQAEALTAIDVDSIEVCRECSRPLALFELARDVGQTFKPSTIVAELGRLASVPAFVVFYRVAGGDICRFRVREVSPKRSRELELHPAEFAGWLQSLRERHVCPAAAPSPASCQHRPRRARTERPVFAPPAQVVATRASASYPVE